MTTALEGDEELASCPGRSLPAGKTRYPLYRRLGGPQGRSGQMRKISPPPEFDPRTVHVLQYDVEYDSSLRHYARYVMKRVMNWQELRNQTQCEDTRNWRNFRKSIRTKSMLQEEEMEERTRNRSFI